MAVSFQLWQRKMQDYSKLMQQLGYCFQDIALLQRALTHRSMKGENNERLEYLGDAVLSMVVAETLFKRQPSAREGQLSRVRSALVNGEVLADIALEFKLNDYLHLGAGEVKSGGQDRRSILADAFEAVIGAIYLEAGLEVVTTCIVQWYKTRFEHVGDVAVIKDAKSKLQEWAQARALALPRYDLQVSGKAHEQTFSVVCHVEGVDLVSQGVGSSRRKAEQNAAEQFLEKLNEQ